MPQLSTQRNGVTTITLLVALVIGGVFATVAIPKVTETKTRHRARMMKADLLNLAAAEQAYFADSARYADAPTLMKAAGYHSSAGVSLPVVRLGARDWSATVTYRDRAGAMCGISVHTTNPISVSTRDGEPVCSTP
jgi:Tfp pilus assembly protein PilE